MVGYGGLGSGVETGDVGLGLDEAVKDCPYGLVMLRGLDFEDLHPLPVGLEPLGRLRTYGFYLLFAGCYAVVGLRVYAEEPFFIRLLLGVHSLHHLGQAHDVGCQRPAGFGGSHGSCTFAFGKSVTKGGRPGYAVLSRLRETPLSSSPPQTVERISKQ